MFDFMKLLSSCQVKQDIKDLLLW
ncbi:hypothetical protein ID866_9260 [Astraeus odoratus]|nr:hypothetical protein ID866_9260 [Astraeus odoratus]